MVLEKQLQLKLLLGFKNIEGKVDKFTDKIGYVPQKFQLIGHYLLEYLILCSYRKS